MQTTLFRNLNLNDKRGVQFYWTQKKPSNARALYSKYCKPGDIIFDPFLGAGSSLYGIRGGGYRFVGVELNQMPFEIAVFNSNRIDASLVQNLIRKITELEDKYGYFYQYKIQGKSYHIEKVVFDNIEAPIVKEIKLKENQVSDEVIEQVKIQYRERYLYYNTKITNLEIPFLEKNSRIAVKDNMKVSDIFSPINFSILKNIRDEIDRDFRFILGSVLHLCRLTDTRSQSQFPYWVPKTNIVDRNVFVTIRKKINSLINLYGIEEISLKSNFSELKSIGSALLFNKPIQKITTDDIPENSIDFVLTDPPYYDQVAYSEYLKIWEYFLGYKSYFKDEIVVSQRLKEKKSEEIYIELLKKSFSIISRALKINAKMLVYFKESRLDKMAQFLDILKDCGFLFEGQSFVDNGKYTYKQNTSKESAIFGECLLIFTNKKKLRITPLKKIQLSPKDCIIDFTVKYLNKKKEASLSELLSNGLIKELYFNTDIKSLKKSAQLVEILNEHFDYSAQNRTYKLKT